MHCIWQCARYHCISLYVYIYIYWRCNLLCCVNHKIMAVMWYEHHGISFFNPLIIWIPLTKGQYCIKHFHAMISCFSVVFVTECGIILYLPGPCFATCSENSGYFYCFHQKTNNCLSSRKTELKIGTGEQSCIFNALWPRQNGSHFTDDTFKIIFLYEKSFILSFTDIISKTTIEDWPALIQMIPSHQWGKPSELIKT